MICILESANRSDLQTLLSLYFFSPTAVLQQKKSSKVSRLAKKEGKENLSTLVQLDLTHFVYG